MFGFGKDGEQKLEQNMEQIKNLVEDGEPEEASEEEEWQPAESNEETWDAPDQEIDEKDLGGRSQEELEEELQDFEQSLEEEEKEEEQEPSWNQAQQEAQSEVDTWSSRDDSWQPAADSVQETEEPSVETPQQEDKEDGSANAQGRVSRDSGVNELNSQIPEPAQTRKLDIPEVDKGPLFIRQRKFERAAQLISDMQYLTDQVEATINSIEEEIQRSSQTEKEVRELIDDFEAGRSEVEDIVSPSE